MKIGFAAGTNLNGRMHQIIDICFYGGGMVKGQTVEEMEAEVQKLSKQKNRHDRSHAEIQGIAN